MAPQGIPAVATPAITGHMNALAGSVPNPSPVAPPGLSSKMNTAQAVETLRGEGGASEDVQYLLKFVEGSKRGVIQ